MVDNAISPSDAGATAQNGGDHDDKSPVKEEASAASSPPIKEEEEKEKETAPSAEDTSSSEPPAKRPRQDSEASPATAADDDGPKNDTNGAAANTTTSTASTDDAASLTDAKKKNPTSSNTNLGRRGDARMHRAVAARLEDPSLSLLEALIAGGFSFPQGTDRTGVSDRNVYDSDNVLLCQRKNQLSRRLRLAKKSHAQSSMSGVNGGVSATGSVPLKKSRVDAGGMGMVHPHNRPPLSGYMHPSFASAASFNPAAMAAAGFGGISGSMENPNNRAHELMQMVLNSSQNGGGHGPGGASPFLQDRRSLGGAGAGHGGAGGSPGMDFNAGGPMGGGGGGTDMVGGDPSQSNPHPPHFANLSAADMQNAFLHHQHQGRFGPPVGAGGGGQSQLFLGGQIPSMNPSFQPGHFGGVPGAGGAPGLGPPSSSDPMGGMGAAPSQGGYPNGGGLDRYLEMYGSSVGMDRDQLQSMMMNRPSPSAANNPPNPNAQTSSTSDASPSAAKHTTTGTEGEAKPSEKQSEESTSAKKDEEGNDDGTSNGDMGESKSSDSQIANRETSMESAGITNGEAASKLHEAMKVYKTQHKALIQDCLVAAGFDQREVEENSRLYSDFEEIVRKECV